MLPSAAPVHAEASNRDPAVPALHSPQPLVEEIFIRGEEAEAEALVEVAVDGVAVGEARADVAVGEARAVVAVAGRSGLGRAAVLLDHAVVDPAGGVLLLVHLL